MNEPGGLSRADIDEILRLVDQSEFAELRLEVGDTRIEVRRAGATSTRPSANAPAAAGAAAPAPSAPRPSAPAPRRPAPSPPGASSGGQDIPAPQLGIFYHAPRPGEPPFVSVGDEIAPDTTIGIIEVMKLMNTVEAGVAGTVIEIVAPNGQSVSQGDTLIRVRPVGSG